MDRRTVEVRVGGQKYKVVSSAGEDELKRLAQVVSAKLGQVAPGGRTLPHQAMLLVAMALAHEAEKERLRREALERRTGELLRRVLAGIDETLGVATSSR
jgi:cell division protein ZapA